MPLRLDVKRKLLARSDRVKSVDLHPTEQWLLAALYNGHVHIWNYETQQLVKSFEVCDLPVRAAKFIARKSWIVTGSDDMQIRIFNYNTGDRVHQFEAHSDYLRSIAVHPTQSFILTSSDDMLVKLWDWDNRWTLKQTFEGHTHYVMQLTINPKDNNQFATASLDKTIKVWQLGSAQPNFTLEGHEKGVNCVDYYHGGDKPYLISGADDHTVKIWDYQNKACVQTLDGHSQNVSSVCFHPELPIILTGSEDSTVRIWHAGTYRLETTLNYGLERVWFITAQRGSNTVAIGYDEGSVTVKLGREEPAASMDVSGKILWARHSEVQQVNLKTLDAAAAEQLQDGERVPISVKDLGASEIYPQTLSHSPNGRYVVACGDGEYIVYTAMALRNKDFGQALDFVWGPEQWFAVRETSSSVKIKNNFKEHLTVRADIVLEGLDGGPLLAARGASSLCFYDWQSGRLVRRIEITARRCVWNDAAQLVAICGEESFYVLRYDAAAWTNAKADSHTDDGVEDTFEVVGEHAESVRTGFWIGDCFVYTNSLNRLCYYVGGQLVTVAHLDRPLYLLGYKDGRAWAVDKELSVVSYRLLESVLEYQTAVMRQDFEAANALLPRIPREQRARVAQFLEKQGYKRVAMNVSTDPEHIFDLALQLGELEKAEELATKAASDDKWKQLAQAATAKGQLGKASEYMALAHDWPGVLLLATCRSSAQDVRRVADESSSQGGLNVAFLSNLLLGRVDECLELLIRSDRLPEAAFFARTHCPSQVSRVVGLWREKAASAGSHALPRVSEAIADPTTYPNLFPGWGQALKAESFGRQLASLTIPAHVRASTTNVGRTLLGELEEAEQSGAVRFDSNGTAQIKPTGGASIQPRPAPVSQPVARVPSPPRKKTPSPSPPPPPPPKQEVKEPEEEEEESADDDPWREDSAEERDHPAPAAYQQQSPAPRSPRQPDVVAPPSAAAAPPDVVADARRVAAAAAAASDDDDDSEFGDAQDIDIDDLNLDEKDD